MDSSFSRVAAYLRILLMESADSFMCGGSGGVCEGPVTRYSTETFKTFAILTAVSTEGENSMICTYQTNNVTKHSFDNLSAVGKRLMNIKDDDIDGETKHWTVKCTAIAGSKEECEKLAIKLHEQGKFNFHKR